MAFWTPRDWDPRRTSGGIYCSPACGGRRKYGCTVAKHDEVKRATAALAARLGPGWRVEMHHNLGWHGTAVSKCGRVRVSGSGRRYMAGIGDPDQSGMRWTVHASSPRAAVREIVRVGKSELAYVVSLVEGLDDVCGRKRKR